MHAFRHAKHDDIEIENVPLTVQVIDPEHPLFGTTYPIVSKETPHGRNWLAMEMPCGSIRVVSHEVTSLNCEPLDLDALLQLPQITMPVLHRLQQLLQKQMQKQEYDHGENPQEAGRNSTRDPSALAPIDPTTARANSGGRAADSASVASTSTATGDGK